MLFGTTQHKSLTLRFKAVNVTHVRETRRAVSFERKPFGAQSQSGTRVARVLTNQS